MKLAQDLQTAIMKHDTKEIKSLFKSNIPEDVAKALVEQDNFGSSAISYILRVGDKEVLNTFIENYLSPKGTKFNINGSAPELEIALRITEFDPYDVIKCLETVYDTQDVSMLLGDQFY